MGMASQAFSELGQMMMAMEPGDAPEMDPLVDPSMLAEAFGETAEAAETALPSDADAAAAMLAALAASAGESAQSMGLQPGMPGGPGTPSETGQGMGTGAQVVDRRLLKVPDEGQDEDEHWARVHGRLRGDARDAAAGRGPKEYRDINEKYFETIAGEEDK